MKHTIDGICVPETFQVPFHVAKQIGEVSGLDLAISIIKDSKSLDPFGKQFLLEEIRSVSQEKAGEASQLLRNKLFNFKRNRTPQYNRTRQQLPEQKAFVNMSRSTAPTLHLNFGK